MIVLDGSGVWGQQWDLGTGVVPGVTGLERGPWASLVTAVNPSYSQHTRYIHQRKKVDGEGRGHGPRVGPAVGGGGGGLEGLDDKFGILSGTDRAEPGLMGKSHGKCWNQQPGRGELPSLEDRD